MPTRRAMVCVWAVATLGAAVPASAQSVVQPSSSSRATGENYHVEISGSLWDPTPAIFISSESIEGILGDRIDFVEDLGIEKSWFTQLKVVLRPGTKHKFRFEYTPIKYQAETVLQRDIVFNGIQFRVALPIESEMTWRAYRFAYEWDFIYRDRGFVGLVLEAKYTDVKAQLTNVFDAEFVRARAPIPAIGVIGRGYVAPNISITSEFTFFKAAGRRRRLRRQLLRLRHLRHRQLQRLRRCPGRLPVLRRLLQGRGRHRRPADPGPVLRRGGPLLTGCRLAPWHARYGVIHTPRKRSSRLSGVDADGRKPEVLVAVTSTAR